MKAAAQNGYGPPESFRATHIATPATGPDEDLVQVTAAGLGADVQHLITDLSGPERLVAGLRRPRPGRSPVTVHERAPRLPVGGDQPNRRSTTVTSFRLCRS